MCTGNDDERVKKSTDTERAQTQKETSCDQSGSTAQTQEEHFPAVAKSNTFAPGQPDVCYKRCHSTPPHAGQEMAFP